MNKENTKKFLDEFPKLYEQYYLNMSQTCMCWGFDCDDGWFDLIYQLSKKLAAAYPEIRAVQVKEKFGGLRFYIGSIDDERYEEIQKLIYEAEEESYKTCERCGTKENVSQTKGGWIRTLCSKCMGEI